MTHLQIELTAVGNELTALSESLDIAKALKKTVYLKLACGKLVSIKPTSDITDLGTVAQLENELYKMSKEKNKTV